MNEPYKTLLSQYLDHPIIGPHLQSDIPNWPTLLHPTNFTSLSDGEQIVINIGLAIYNSNRDATIADLAHLDNETYARVIAALIYCRWGIAESGIPPHPF